MNLSDLPILAKHYHLIAVHYKGGSYRIIDLATHTETGEQMVVYTSEQSTKRKTTWVRPLAMFAEMVEHDGQLVPRFKLAKAKNQSAVDLQ